MAEFWIQNEVINWIWKKKQANQKQKQKWGETQPDPKQCGWDLAHKVPCFVLYYFVVVVFFWEGKGHVFEGKYSL